VRATKGTEGANPPGRSAVAYCTQALAARTTDHGFRSLPAGNAFQPLTHHAGPAGLGHDPWTDLPRRLVAHVSGVAALEIGDPLTFDVLVKTDDPPPHLPHLTAQPFQAATAPGRGPCR